MQTHLLKRAQKQIQQMEEELQVELFVCQSSTLFVIDRR